MMAPTLQARPPAPILEALVARIRAAVPEVVAVYLYGSVATGTTHPESDLDLALLLPHQARVPPPVLLRLRGELEVLAQRPIDLSLLDPALQVVHCKEVVSLGVPLFVRDRDAVAVFEMQVFSSYARLCEERAPVVAAYTQDGARG